MLRICKGLGGGAKAQTAQGGYRQARDAGRTFTCPPRALGKRVSYTLSAQIPFSVAVAATVNRVATQLMVAFLGSDPNVNRRAGSSARDSVRVVRRAAGERQGSNRSVAGIGRGCLERTEPDFAAPGRLPEIWWRGPRSRRENSFYPASESAVAARRSGNYRIPRLDFQQGKPRHPGPGQSAICTCRSRVPRARFSIELHAVSRSFCRRPSTRILLATPTPPSAIAAPGDRRAPPGL